MNESTKLSNIKYLNENLNWSKCWLTSGMEMAIMGTFTSIENQYVVIQDVLHVIEYYKKSRKFKTMFMSKSRLLTFSSILVSVDYPSETLAPFLNGIIDNRVNYLSLLIDQYSYYDKGNNVVGDGN
jgi:hypothetical protein